MPEYPPYMTATRHSLLREENLTMAKLILLVALAFSITTGSITVLVLNPQPAMACPGNNGR